EQSESGSSCSYKSLPQQVATENKVDTPRKGLTIRNTLEVKNTVFLGKDVTSRTVDLSSQNPFGSPVTSSRASTPVDHVNATGLNLDESSTSAYFRDIYSLEAQ